MHYAKIVYANGDIWASIPLPRGYRKSAPRRTVVLYSNAEDKHDTIRLPYDSFQDLWIEDGNDTADHIAGTQVEEDAGSAIEFRFSKDDLTEPARWPDWLKDRAEGYRMASPAQPLQLLTEDGTRNVGAGDIARLTASGEVSLLKAKGARDGFRPDELGVNGETS